MKRDGFIGRLGRQVSRRVGNGTRSLLSSAGKAEGTASFEALEPRVLLAADGALAVDAPSLDEVFPDSGTGVLPSITDTEFFSPSSGGLVAGVGVTAGAMDSGDLEDMFRFTADRDGFISILAATGSGSDLDTALEVYLPDGTQVTGATSGLDNGNLSRGFDSDGWFGFVAENAQEYYIRVIGENAGDFDPSSPQSYTININAVNETLALDAGGVARTGSDTGEQESILVEQQDRLYTFTTGSEASLGSVLAGDVVFGDDAAGYINTDPTMFDRDLFDSRVEVFDAAGTLIASDSDSGFIYDAYALVRFESSSTYYVRVRSDASQETLIIDPQADALGGETDTPTGPGADPDSNLDDVSKGEFELRIQTQATQLTLDNESRLIEVDRSSSGRDIETNVVPAMPTPDPAGLLRDQHSAQIFTFETLTAGTTFVNFFLFAERDPAAPAGTFVPRLDSTLTLFDESGSVVPLQSNDTLAQGDGFDRPGLTFESGAGERFFVMVDFFDGEFFVTGQDAGDAVAGELDYRLVVESSVVLDESDPDQRVDDHIDFTTTDNGGTAVVDQRVADFATPLVWGDPVTPRGFIDDTFFDTADNVPVFGVLDEYLFPGLLDPRLTDDPANAVYDVLDHSRVVRAAGGGRIDNPGDSDVFMFVPQVDMLGSHAGAIDPLSGAGGDGEAPGQLWFADGRPASRLTVNVFFETEWVNLGSSSVQIFDSNFNLVNEAFATPISSVIAGGGNDDNQIPAGVETPSLLPPGPDAGDNVDQQKVAAAVTLDNQYWGGEVYYLVVRLGNGAIADETRYNVFLQADAFDEDDTQYAFDVEVAEEGDFGSATELVFSNNSGIATNNGNLSFAGDIREIPSLVANVFDEEEEIDDGMGGTIPNPNFGMPDSTNPDFYDNALYFGQLGNINALDDTDLFRFTAQNNGTAEILLSTTNLQDAFTEQLIDSVNNNRITVQNTLFKTYNSPLDAAFRVFNSAGQQIAYVNDFLGYGAEGNALTFPAGEGAIGTIQVERKDPRLVIEVERGEQYFVLVESSQRWSANAEAANAADRTAALPSQGEVDWRRAVGSYQLVVNTTPNQSGDNDDHADFDFARNFQASVIPFDSDPSSPDNGTGSVSGVIESEGDTDAFEFLAPATGIVTLTLDPAGDLSMVASLFDGNTAQIPLVPSSAIAGEQLVVQFAAVQGERYLLQVGGLNGTGTYEITLSGLPVADDFAGEGRYNDAADLSFGAFDREVSTTGSLEQAGDTDIFTFVAPESDFLTINLSEDNSFGFAGSIEVYELGTDPSGVVLDLDMSGPIQNHYLVGYDVNPDLASELSAQVSVQQGRTYFVVVRGADARTTTGDYTLELTFNPEDDHADIGELLDATFVNVVPELGTGSITGVLEQGSDSDLFVFGAPAAGPVTVSLTWASAPPAAFTIQLFDINGDALDVNNDGMVDAGDTLTGTGGTLVLPSVDAATGDIFYAAVTGPLAVGITYTLNVNTGLIDDHANEGDLASASLITLSPTTGDGSRTGVLEVDDDTDLFTFAVSDGANIDVLISTAEIDTPVLRIFDASGALVTTTTITGGVRFTNTSGGDSVFYASVGSTFPGFQSGAYTITVDGPPAPPAPNDDHADEGDLVGATVLVANALTGDASSLGVLNVPLDSDLFRYDTIGRGSIFVQVVSPDVPTPDFTIRVFDDLGNEITGLADSAGVAGANGVTAATEIVASGAGETYYLLVESTGDTDVGNYTLRLDGVAGTSVVFYPEGFANASIQQFVSIANPNAESVDYTVRVYYADAMLGSAVVATGTLGAGARGGATLSFGGDIDDDGLADFAPGIIANAPYAVAVESTLRVAAGFSHYDRGILSTAQDPMGLDRTPGGIGEAFTDRLSTTWAFPDVERNPGIVEEFLVYFNPNSFDVDLTVTAFTTAGEVTLSTITLGANRRGGLEIHNTTAFPLGTFAVELTAAATDPANESANLGVVASISRYNLVDLTAYGYLGVPDGGSTFNVIPTLTEGPSVDSEINLFNPGDSATTVTITGTYKTDQNLPDLTRIVTLAGGQRITLTGQSLAFVPNTPIGLTITSGSAIAASSIETQRGDATAVAAFTEAGTSFFFGDAFLNPDQAGALYSEALVFYNPGTADANVSVTFLFADGTASRMRMEVVEAEGFLRLQLEDLAEVVNDRPRLNFFSIQVDSDTAIVSQLSHFDGFLGGGWASGGAPLGLVNSIA